MDDLLLVRELGDDTPLPTPDELAPARAELLAHMTKRKPHRFVIAGAATIGLAAAIAAVIMLVPAVQPPSAPTPLTAVQLLSHAADAARAKPDVVPRPDQFYYTRSGDSESWQSVDGTHDGLLIVAGDRSLLPGCRNGRSAAVIGEKVIPGVSHPCKPGGAYRSDLPTSADAMFAYLMNLPNPENRDPADLSFRTLQFLIWDSYLPSQQRAALFEAAAKMPGLQVVRDVKDGSGRPGIGITDVKAPDFVMVFDANTYEHLGDTDRAIDASGFVDAVDQRP